MKSKAKKFWDMNHKSKKSKLRSFSEASKLHFLLGKRKSSTAQKKRKISLPLESAGRHAVARRSIRGRSSSNLTLEKSPKSPSISLPDIVSVKMSRQQSPSSQKKSSRIPKVILGSSNGSLNVPTDYEPLNSNLGGTEEHEHEDNQNTKDSNSLTNTYSRRNILTGGRSVNTSGNANESRNTTDSQQDENKENSGMFSSLISAAHNAASHLMRKSSQKDPQEPTNDINDEEQENTVMYKPLPIEHNPSFLQHLDFLLSTGPMPAPDLISPRSSTVSERSNHLSLDPRSSALPSETPSIVINPAESENELSRQATETMSLAEKVKFQPLKGESHIATFGKGNLTLDALGMKEDNEQPLEQGSTSSGPSGRPEFYALNRKRGKTVSVSEMKSDLKQRSSSTDTNLSLSPVRTDPAGDKGIIDGESISPKSGAVPASNNTIVGDGGDNRSRKRSNTKKFMSRRSFSPSTALKIIPSAGLRNSFHRMRSYSTGDDIYVETSSLSSDEAVSSNYQEDGKKRLLKLRNVSYAAEKKNNEFHTIFKEAGISPEEKLLTDFSCALSRDILLQGRMFISEKHICFNSSILGWVTTVVIPFREIVQIEKKSTAGIFPNGIVFQTLHTKYIFASFMSRDSTFDYITSIWNQIILGVDSQRVHDDISDSTDSVNENENENENDNHDTDAETRSRVISQGYSSDEYSDDEVSSDSDMTTSDRSDSGQSSYGTETTASTSIQENSSPSTVSTIGPSKHAPTTTNFLKNNNDRVIADTVFEAPLGKIVNILYGDNVSFLRQILEAQKNYDISEIPPILASKERQYTYTKPISGAIGPSKTSCHITETLAHYDLSEYVKAIQISKTPDVPSGSSFYVKTSFFLSWAPNDATKLTVLASVEWTGKSWVKAAVEKGSFDGITSSTKILIDEVNRFLKESSTKSKEESEKIGSDKDESLNLPTTGPSTHAPTQPDYVSEDGDVIISEALSFPIPLGTTFEVLFGSDTTYCQRIIEKQGNYDLSDIPKFNNNRREYEYTKPLNGPVGPKKTKCLIEERIECKDFNTYVMVRQITKTPDVPSGSSFAVHTKFYLSWGPNNTTKMMIVTNVVWTAKSWIKSAVEKGSIDGQKTSIAVLEKELQDIIIRAGTKKKNGKKRLKIKIKKPKASKKKQLPTETPTSERSGFIGDLMDLFFSSQKNIPQNVVLIVLGILLVSIFSKFVHRGHQPSFELVKPGQIVIDGNSYNYAPSLGTLYEVYEQEIRSGKKGRRTNNVVTTAESGIWNWIQDRGDTLQRVSSSEFHGPHLSTHERQDLEETIRVAEIQLNELKAQLSNCS